MDPKSQHGEPTSEFGKSKKKSSGAVKIFKAALFMLRRRSKKSKAATDMGSDKSMWRRMLGSMRPLHVQGNGSPPTVAGIDMSLAPSKLKEKSKESPMALPLSSPPSSFSHTSRSSSFGTSQYASAINLQELDDSNDDDDDKNAINDDNGGDEMIDAKAEEFIAQFYEQMRRQRHNY